jgi:hypothetical protein
MQRDAVVKQQQIIVILIPMIIHEFINKQLFTDFFKKLFIMSLLAVGTVAFDDIETPMGRAEMAIGGAATYITLAASHFLNDLRLVSVIGDDFPQDTRYSTDCSIVFGGK